MIQIKSQMDAQMAQYAFIMLVAGVGTAVPAALMKSLVHASDHPTMLHSMSQPSRIVPLDAIGAWRVLGICVDDGAGVWLTQQV